MDQSRGVQGEPSGVNRIYGLYREEGLAVRNGDLGVMAKQVRSAVAWVNKNAVKFGGAPRHSG